MEKEAGETYTHVQILEQLRKMRFYEISPGENLPAYTHNALTDHLHGVMGFYTDYEILSH
uniref:hypothetical protein n=1 Tax=Ndongobacter massiliensis TaxID=1871025 RepID=UPI000930F9FD|nr:hypothetical protein [Ndongobacter massiliensis]